MDFASIIKDEKLLRAIKELEWEELTPVQEAAIPLAKAGTDLMAQAQTGTGKTGAFAVPIIEKLQVTKHIQCLVLTPTRAPAMQVAGDFADLAKYVGLRIVPIYGGQSSNVQTDKLSKGAEIVVGTPGRLMDLMRRGELNFDHVRFLVLDEADRMLDMGFIDDIEWILGRVPKDRQTMLFSATLPEEIRELAQRYMRKPKELIVSADTLTGPPAQQVYVNVARTNKLWALCRILDIENVTHVINWDIPENPEDYVHRIGRTARAGKAGKAITFVSQDEQHLVRQIERVARSELDGKDVPEGTR